MLAYNQSGKTFVAETADELVIYTNETHVNHLIRPTVAFLIAF